VRLSTRLIQQLFESSPELNIEDCVDNWIEETVDVAEPDKEAEEHAVYVTFRPIKQLKPDTDGVHYVHGEEWNPA
jgi:hypothetical protein